MADPSSLATGAAAATPRQTPPTGQRAGATSRTNKPYAPLSVGRLTPARMDEPFPTTPLGVPPPAGSTPASHQRCGVATVPPIHCGGRALSSSQAPSTYAGSASRQDTPVVHSPWHTATANGSSTQTASHLANHSVHSAQSSMTSPVGPTALSYTPDISLSLGAAGLGMLPPGGRPNSASLADQLRDCPSGYDGGVVSMRVGSYSPRMAYVPSAFLPPGSGSGSTAQPHQRHHPASQSTSPHHASGPGQSASGYQYGAAAPPHPQQQPSSSYAPFHQQHTAPLSSHARGDGAFSTPMGDTPSVYPPYLQQHHHHHHQASPSPFPSQPLQYGTQPHGPPPTPPCGPPCRDSFSPPLPHGNATGPRGSRGCGSLTAPPTAPFPARRTDAGTAEAAPAGPRDSRPQTAVGRSRRSAQRRTVGVSVQHASTTTQDDEVGKHLDGEGNRHQSDPAVRRLYSPEPRLAAGRSSNHEKSNRDETPDDADTHSPTPVCTAEKVKNATHSAAPATNHMGEDPPSVDLWAEELAEFARRTSVAQQERPLSPPKDPEKLRAALEHLVTAPAHAFEIPAAPLDLEGRVVKASQVASRRRQITLGLLQPEYRRYVSLVPKDQRQHGNPHHPVTPRASYGTKRPFMAILHSWRCALHEWADADPKAVELPPSALARCVYDPANYPQYAALRPTEMVTAADAMPAVVALLNPSDADPLRGSAARDDVSPSPVANDGGARTNQETKGTALLAEVVDKPFDDSPIDDGLRTPTAQLAPASPLVSDASGLRGSGSKNTPLFRPTPVKAQHASPSPARQVSRYLRRQSR